MATNTYRTIQGDAWDLIAFRLWPKEQRKTQRPELLMHHLMLANPEHMDTLIFPAGVELMIPNIENVAEKVAVPAWRKEA